MGRAAAVVIKEIDGLLDELAESVAEPLPGAAATEVVQGLGEVRNRVEAAFAKAVGYVGSTNAYAYDGARSLSVWLQWRLHLSKTHADMTVRNERALRSMRLTQEWFDAGKISFAQVRLLRSALEARPEAFKRDEQMLLEQSAVLWHDHFARAIKHWIYVNNEDEEDRKARERYERRTLRVVDSWDDMVDISGHLDVINGAMFKNELKRIESELFDLDWREAEARLGRKPALHELARTPAQRRADALVEMARRSYALADDAPRPRPLVTVVIDHPTVKRLCQLADGTFVTPGEILPLFCDCDIERVIFGANSRVLDVGQKRRFFTGATRRAVEIRDLACTRPTCDVPYEDCEIDHVQPWALGGATSQQNGRCACRHDNRSRPRSQLGGDGDDDSSDW